MVPKRNGGKPVVEPVERFGRMRPALDEVADAEKPVAGGVELECGERPV